MPRKKIHGFIPHDCKICGEPVEVKQNIKVSSYNLKETCSRKCSEVLRVLRHTDPNYKREVKKEIVIKAEKKENTGKSEMQERMKRLAAATDMLSKFTTR